jgi:hypothetical protein
MAKKTDKPESEPHAELLVEARKRFEICRNAGKTNKERALKALRFRNLEQWDEAVKKERETDSEGARPCLVMDKLNQHINQVVNDERQNRPQIKVRPVDDKADVEAAKIYDGLIRHIQDRSCADEAYDTAFEHAVDGGYGFWRILTEYCDENSFEQEIVIKRIRNRFAASLDPNKQEADGSDAQYGFIVNSYTKDEFEAEFGKDSVNSWSTDGFAHGWYEGENILVAEYFYIKPRKETIVQLEDGRVITKKEFETTPPTYVDGTPLPILVDAKGKPKERVTTINEVKWCKLTYDKVLEGPTDWAGKYIPIIEIVGNELDIEGEVYKSGLVYGAMDAQRVYNYASSAFVENVALAPRAPWTAAEGQIEGHEELWRTANRRNISVLPYKPVDANGILVPPPQRAAPPGIPVGWQGVLQNAEHDIQGATGQYAASLGEESNEKSGKAILARQREGDVGTFHYADNLSRAMRHTGRILLDLIPKYYDTKRAIRIIGEDGTPGQATIDPEMKEAYVKGPDGDIFNPTVGKYDVTVTVGPAYTTRRMEAAEWQLQMIQANPDMMQVMGDIMFRNMDAPGAEEIAERIKKTIPPQLLDEDESDEPMVMTPQGPIPAAQAGQTIVQLTQQTEMAVQTMEAMQEEIDKLKSGEMSKIAATEAKTQEAIRQAEIDADITLQKINIDADVALQKADKDAQTKIKVALIDHDATLKIAAMTAVNSGEGEQPEQNEDNDLLLQSIEALLVGNQAIYKATVAPRKSEIEVGPDGMATGATSYPVLE